jgi:hypothetical protein
MPGRSTLTATSRPPGQAGEVHLGDRRAGHGLGVELLEHLLERPPVGLLHQAAGHRGGERRHTVLQFRQLVGHVQRQQVAPCRQHLAELDEDRPQPLAGAAQAHAARLVQPASERDQAHQRAHPALAEPRQRHLVDAEANDREDDQDQAGQLPHREAA